MKDKKYFFGWTNIKWFIRETTNIHSSKKSFFSKKRIESSLAFLIGQWGMVFFLMENHSNMTTSDIVLWSSVEFAVSGYILNQIQREKRNNKSENLDEE